MRIGKILNNSFGSTIKVNVPKEIITIDENGRMKPSQLSVVKTIAGDNKLGVLIGQDILIEDANEKVEEDLKNANIPYVVIDKIDITV